MQIVTLLSDFGTRDGYAAAMKGVILCRAPRAQIVDLTHDIPPQDIAAGAWALQQAVPFFPRGTIHVAVVDPGVGSSRWPLVVADAGQVLVGPDNGLLSLAAGLDAQAWAIDVARLALSPISATFHGRDVFANVAGHLADGMPIARSGEPVDDWCRLGRLAPMQSETMLEGAVVHIDRFGNLITDLSKAMFDSRPHWRVLLGDRVVGRVQQTFSSVAPGQWVAYLGSAGYLEIAVRDGSAASNGIRRGQRVVCSADDDASPP